MRSDIPTPRWSKTISLENDERCSAMRPWYVGISVMSSTRDEARVVDDIERPVAVDAIRDRDVAAAGVAGFRLHRHSVAPALLPC
jgi:hypothetical protein